MQFPNSKVGRRRRDGHDAANRTLFRWRRRRRAIWKRVIGLSLMATEEVTYRIRFTKIKQWWKWFSMKNNELCKNQGETEGWTGNCNACSLVATKYFLREVVIACLSLQLKFTCHSRPCRKEQKEIGSSKVQVDNECCWQQDDVLIGRHYYSELLFPTSHGQVNKCNPLRRAAVWDKEIRSQKRANFRRRYNFL